MQPIIQVTNGFVKTAFGTIISIVPVRKGVKSPSPEPILYSGVPHIYDVLFENRNMNFLICVNNRGSQSSLVLEMNQNDSESWLLVSAGDEKMCNAVTPGELLKFGSHGLSNMQIRFRANYLKTQESTHFCSAVPKNQSIEFEIIFKDANM